MELSFIINRRSIKVKLDLVVKLVSDIRFTLEIRELQKRLK